MTRQKRKWFCYTSTFLSVFDFFDLFAIFIGTILKQIILFTELEGADEKKFFLKKSFVTPFETEVQVQARVG